LVKKKVKNSESGRVGKVSTESNVCGEEKIPGKKKDRRAEETRMGKNNPSGRKRQRGALAQPI